MKRYFNNILNKFGFDIRKVDNGFCSQESIEWLCKFNFKTILDIGANEGQFALFISKLFKNANIYSFEPIMESYNKLKLKKNKINNLYTFNYALGDNEEYLDFYLNDFTPASSLLKISNETLKNFPFTDEQSLIKIEVRKLDGILNDLTIRPNVLCKIDVQGYEDKVILGGSTFFKQLSPVVIVETSYTELYEHSPLFDTIYNQFKEMGYSFCGNLDQLFSPIDGTIIQGDAIFIKM